MDFKQVDIVMLIRLNKTNSQRESHKESHMLDASNLRRIYVYVYRTCGLRLHGKRNGSDGVGRRIERTITDATAKIADRDMPV